MLKKIFKKIIVFIITSEAKLVLKKYNPKIIAVTGSVGKTSAKDAIATILGQKFFVRKSVKSYNSEIGVPLTVLGCETGWLNPFIWFANILKGIKLLAIKTDYPAWLVLEMGVERPGDMEKLVSWIKPYAVVVTALAEIPPHVEFFASPEELIGEKMKILDNLKSDNFLILNSDDKTLCEAKNKTQAKTLAFGFGEDADLRASNYRIVFRKEDSFEIPEGISFKLDCRGSSFPVRIFGAFGSHQVYSGLAALAIGIVADFNIIDVSESLSRYRPPPGRLRLIEGIKKTFILDDTYNASPSAVHAALDTLAEIPSTGRKIAVLGDMLELGKYTIDSHKAVGRRVAKIADFLFVIGPRSRFISEEARLNGFNPENIFEFSESGEAGIPLQDILKEGDLILVKGSQAMRMEKIVEEIMVHPEQKEALLVRQEKEWQDK